MSKSITVVGAGAIGLSIAWELSQRGFKVTVIDKSVTGRGTSWAGAGILPPANLGNSFDPIDRLRGLSHQLFPEWAEKLKTDTGIDPGLQRCGGLYLAETVGEIAAMSGMTEYWQEMGIECKQLTSDEIIGQEAALADWWRNTDNAAAWRVPDEYQLRSPNYLSALKAACAQLGVIVLENTDVTDIRCLGARAEIQYEGNWQTTDGIVLTAGVWTGQLAASLDLELSIVPIRGQILLLKTSRPLIRNIINMGQRYVLARGDGHTLIGSNEEEMGFELGTTDSVLKSLMDFATHLLPALKTAEHVKSWSGLRPMTFDGFPMIGPVPGVENLYVAAGHYRSGLHLSPGTAVLIADMLSEEKPQIPIDAFQISKHKSKHDVRPYTTT
ncbi:MAG: NAD(P)/FAD-dependent oxidoreductase [Rubripirellula sp.]